MHPQRINRASGVVVVLLSLTALVTVLTGYNQQPQPDEGTGAHIFQLSVAAVVPMLLLFVATADWRRPLQTVRPLVFSAIALVAAFGLLYYLEHVLWATG